MNKSEKLAKLQEAAAKMRDAAGILEEIRDDKSDSYFLCEDARYFTYKLEELLSSDRGEAGIESLIRIIDGRLSPYRRPSQDKTEEESQ